MTEVSDNIIEKLAELDAERWALGAQEDLGAFIAYLDRKLPEVIAFEAAMNSAESEGRTEGEN